jgi:hypothetical protein
VESVFFAKTGYESCTSIRSVATRMHYGSIFSGFSMKTRFFPPPYFTHLFSGQISPRLQVNPENGLYQTCFFPLI